MSDSKGLAVSDGAYLMAASRQAIVRESACEITEIAELFRLKAIEIGADDCYMLRGVAMRLKVLGGAILSAVDDEMDSTEEISLRVRG